RSGAGSRNDGVADSDGEDGGVGGGWNGIACEKKPESRKAGEPESLNACAFKLSSFQAFKLSKRFSHVSSSLQRPRHREFIGVVEIAADGNRHRDLCDA